MTEPTGLVPALTGFAAELRAAGLAVGSGDVVAHASALAALDPTDLLDLYWSGRATLVRRRDDLPCYDEVFRRYFLGADVPARQELVLRPRSVAQTEAMLAAPDSERRGDAAEERPTPMGLLASDVDSLRGKSFTACTDDELAAVRRIVRRLTLTPPRRRTRRSVRSRAGRTPDVRRMVRESLRRHGEPPELFRRARRRRLRPLVLVLDVSGSMADYSRSLLQFGYSARRAAARVEVFCFGTRLTRITDELHRRRPDEAMARAAAAVCDWDGGTRIGASLDAFVRDWARRGRCRGGVVVICSDGLDRGDPAVLADAMARLSRLCHRVVWLDPHHAPAAPRSVGLAAAAPYVDLFLPARDLHSLEEFARELPRLG